MTTEVVQQHWLETYKSLITLSIECFKFSALANGGAAVAVLAYLSNVAGSKCLHSPDMRMPMGAFLAGLFACGLAMVFAYLTQLKLLNEISPSQKPALRHTWLLWTTIVFFIGGLIAFGVGSWQAVIRFH